MAIYSPWYLCRKLSAPAWKANDERHCVVVTGGQPRVVVRRADVVPMVSPAIISSGNKPSQVSLPCAVPIVAASMKTIVMVDG